MEPSESITNPLELDETVYKFTEACNIDFKVACPTEKPRGRKKPPWWTQQPTFCSDIKKTTDVASLWKILSKTAAPLGYLQKANGSWSDSSKESLDLLLDGHPPERGAGEGIELDPLLSDRNMKWSIHSFKPYKSPGPDGISPAHIQQAGQIAINWLKKIF